MSRGGITRPGPAIWKLSQELALLSLGQGALKGDTPAFKLIKGEIDVLSAVPEGEGGAAGGGGFQLSSAVQHGAQATLGGRAPSRGTVESTLAPRGLSRVILCSRADLSVHLPGAAWL